MAEEVKKEIERFQKKVIDYETKLDPIIPSDTDGPKVPTTAELAGSDGMGLYYREKIKNYQEEIHYLEEKLKNLNTGKANLEYQKTVGLMKKRPPLVVPLNPVGIFSRGYKFTDDGKLQRLQPQDAAAVDRGEGTAKRIPVGRGGGREKPLIAVDIKTRRFEMDEKGQLKPFSASESETT